MGSLNFMANELTTVQETELPLLVEKNEIGIF
jgi:hypothetical protein